MPAVLLVRILVGRIRPPAPSVRRLPVPEHDAEPVLQALGFGPHREDPEAVRDHGTDHSIGGDDVSRGFRPILVVDTAASQHLIH